MVRCSVGTVAGQKTRTPPIARSRETARGEARAWVWGLSQAGHRGERPPQNEARARLQDLHLTARHGGDRGVVRGGGDAGAQGGVHAERDLGQVRLDGEGVADHADVGAQAAEFDGVDGLGVVLRDEPAGKVERSERGLFEHGSAAVGANRLEGGCELPAGRAGDAVGNGQVASLLRGGVVAVVGVLGENDRAVEAVGALGDRLDDGLRLGRAQGAVDEVVLHVDDDEVGVGHGEGSFGVGIALINIV